MRVQKALDHERAKQRIVAARGDQTARTRVFDLIRGYAWPRIYIGRAIGNSIARFAAAAYGPDCRLQARAEA